MASTPSSGNLMTTTLLVSNIHCPSCVSYARDVLSPFSSAVRQFDISIIDHTIRIQHIGDISSQLTRKLIEAAFEVEHVTAYDSQGNILKEVSPQHAETALPSRFTDALFMSKAQRKHIKNCSACQKQRHENNAALTMWAGSLRLGLKRKRSAGVDVEHGTPRSGSTRSEKVAAVHDSNQQDQHDSDEVYTAILLVEGMTCASCVSAITNELEQQDYIGSVNVNLMANNAKVTFQGPRSRVNEIKDAIEDIGYGAEIEDVQLQRRDPKQTDLWKVSLTIDGMTCGSCVGTITRGLQELPVVRSANVDLINHSATVQFEGRDNLDTLLEKISDLGYDAKAGDTEEIRSGRPGDDLEMRSVQIQIRGMYCPNCPPNITTAVQETFHGVRIGQEPSLKNPYMTVVYRPDVPTLTIRHIIEVINSVDEACSATVYHAPTLEERSRSIQFKERNRILRHLIVALLVAIPTFIIGVVYMSLVSEDNHTRQWFEEPIWAGTAMRVDWALFIMTTPSMFYSANLFHTRALKEVWTLWRPGSTVPFLKRFYRFGSMNLLISAGTAVAYFASLAVLIMDATSSMQEGRMSRGSSTYFDTVTFLTLFILIGRFLEAYSKAKAGDAVSMLSNLRPSTALLIEDNIQTEQKRTKTSVKEISVNVLEIGDIVSVPHGACPPIDGIIAQEGTYLFDESSLTGESKPARKELNDKVFTGTVNIGDPVRITVTELGGRSMLDQIVNVVREGQAKRAPIERLADALTGFFTPVITLLAISTWIIWLALGESGALPQGWLDVDKGGWPYWSVEFAIAVFVVACPCGIGLAAPTALFVGGGLAAKNGILVQGGGEAFQEASRTDAIVFDKTGTLTEGQMKVTDVEFLNPGDVSQGIVYGISKSLEEASTHPIAKAVVSHCDKGIEDADMLTIQSSSLKDIPGQGMSGTFEIQTNTVVETYEAIIGSERLFSTITDNRSKKDEKLATGTSITTSNVFLSSTLSRFQNAGNSTAILAIRPKATQGKEPTAYRPVAVFAIADPLRAEAPLVLASLRSQGIAVHMCTGDNARTAQSIASQLSIPLSNVQAGVLPQGKASYIQSLQRPSSGHRKIVAFVGDGTNDTPALTVADVSVALSHPETGGGSDIALTSSSFVLLNSDLNSIVTLIKLSKRVFLRVRLNFFWAAIYNICLVPVAAGVFFPVGATWGDNAHGGFRLSPVWASVAMAGSSVSVVLSSLALRLPEVQIKGWSGWLRRKNVREQ